MSRAEALQLQLDTAQRDKQQLEAENARLREDSALRCHCRAWRLRAETLQLGAVYDHAAVEGFTGGTPDAGGPSGVSAWLHVEMIETPIEEFSYECESLKGEVATAELERYRALDNGRDRSGKPERKDCCCSWSSCRLQWRGACMSTAC